MSKDSRNKAADGCASIKTGLEHSIRCTDKTVKVLRPSC